LRGEAPAEIPFAHLLRYLDGVILVSEAQIQDAMTVAAVELKQVLEPSGAVSLAGLLNHDDELPAGIRIAVLSGGNVDLVRYKELLRST
jgi:threo-3-hydroxy-L-aspartate ammonia-lyase